ncbi:adenosine kinase [Stygiomarasmius scandens]|uniref:adenosine kinase n=1 Tax=Marasmiellus scandens TaxID=2682957 RepID=A0ABR1JNK0_9AGAR
MSTTSESYSSYLLLCIGHPLLDIQVRNGSERLLEKYKLKEDDAILAGDEQKGIYDEITRDYEATYVAGGAAQNTARGAAYILPPKTVAFTGCVGEDEAAEKLREADRREGVLELCQVKKGGKTGACAVMVSGSNRSLVTTLRSAKELEDSHLYTPKLASVIENIKVLYITCFNLTHNPDIVINLAERAYRQGKLVVLNFSAPYILRLHNSAIQRISPYCGIIIANEAEALTWAEVKGIPLSNTDSPVDSDGLSEENRPRSASSPHPSIPEIARAIALSPKFSESTSSSQDDPALTSSSTSRIVLITSGSHSTTLVHSLYPDRPRTYPVPPLKPHELVDTNAAGDAFAGGFLAAYIRRRFLQGQNIVGKDTRDHANTEKRPNESEDLTWVDECVKMGHWLAGMCCGQVGGQYRWPKVDIPDKL